MTVLYDTTYYVDGEEIWSDIQEDILDEYNRLYEINTDIAKRYKQDIIDSERENIDKEIRTEFWGEMQRADKEALSEGDTVYVRYGTAGLWNGRKNLVPKMYSSLCDALESTMCTTSVHDTIVEETDEGLRIKHIHHDGTNFLYLCKVKDVSEVQQMLEDTFTDYNECGSFEEAFAEYIDYIGDNKEQWQEFLDNYTEPVYVRKAVCC